LRRAITWYQGLIEGFMPDNMSFFKNSDSIHFSHIIQAYIRETETGHFADDGNQAPDAREFNDKKC